MIVPTDDGLCALVVNAAYRLNAMGSDINQCPVCMDVDENRKPGERQRICPPCLRIIKAIWVAGAKGDIGNA